MTNRKKVKTGWQTFFFCFYDEDELEFDPHAQQAENYYLIEMLIFSGDHWAYQLFCYLISILYLVTSYGYLYIAANRYSLSLHYDDHWKMVFYFESLFAIHMILQFFKEFQQEGAGDESKPVRNWGNIIQNYVTGTFLIDFIPLIPL